MKAETRNPAMRQTCLWLPLRKGLHGNRCWKLERFSCIVANALKSYLKISSMFIIIEIKVTTYSCWRVQGKLFSKWIQGSWLSNIPQAAPQKHEFVEIVIYHSLIHTNTHKHREGVFCWLDTRWFPLTNTCFYEQIHQCQGIQTMAQRK